MGSGVSAQARKNARGSLNEICYGKPIDASDVKVNNHSSFFHFSFTFHQTFDEAKLEIIRLRKFIKKFEEYLNGLEILFT